MINLLSGKNENEIQSEINILKNIKANDLSSKGARAANESDIMNEIYIDESKKLYREHQKDMEKIANATSNLLNNLLLRLKEIGVDCKQVKGNKEIEPEYLIDIQKKHSKDARYDPATCEELRNKYYCQDVLSLRCIKKGKKYGDWQHRTIKLNGVELHNDRMNWGFAVKARRKKWDWLITPHHPKVLRFWGSGNKQVDSIWRNNPGAIINDARIFISQKLGIDLEQVREDIIFPSDGKGIGGQTWGVGRWRHVWIEYEFGYYYRDVSDICEEWSEDWSEECKL